MIRDPDIYALFLEFHDKLKYENGRLIRRKTTTYRSLAGDFADRNYQHNYRQVYVRSVLYGAHRVIFLMLRGYLPIEVDHINGVKSDNRIENLRAATKVQNQQNSRTRKDNTSGIKGVCWHKSMGRWMAQCTANKKYTCLGYFDSADEAGKAVREFRSIHHGEFANHG